MGTLSTRFYDHVCRISSSEYKDFSQEYKLEYIEHKNECHICAEKTHFVENTNNISICSIECLEKFDDLIEEVLKK